MRLSLQNKIISIQQVVSCEAQVFIHVFFLLPDLARFYARIRFRLDRYRTLSVSNTKWTH